jgi:UDP-N-acetylmuramyl pentapeptide phosphotransferase/UDP-N-acetylglucosamine-1-phosphate transferase
VITTAAAFATALVLGMLARRLGPVVGAMDRPDGTTMKPHPDAVSWLGGAAAVGGLAAGLATEGWPLPWAGAAAVGGAFALGLADDALDVPPVLRLAAQVGLGLLLAGGGLAADALPGAALAWTAAAVLFAAALNAVNMVDGMDGLAGIIGAISALGLALIAARSGHDGSMVVALATAGALAGFLVHNLPPARLYLGDNGAYALAAALTVVVLAGSRTVAGLVGGATCLGVFLVDLLLSVLRRVVRRRRLTAGDRDHLYDQLQGRGLAPRWTLAVCAVVHVAFVAVGVRAAGSATSVAVATVGTAWMVALVWLVWSGLVAAGPGGADGARRNGGREP